MKKLVLISLLLLASTQAYAVDLLKDLKDCTIDAANYTALATMAMAVTDEKTWSKIVANQALAAHSKEQQDWIIEAAALAWVSKGQSSPVAQGMGLYDECVKSLKINTT